MSVHRLPLLPNPRHEAFAQAVASGKNATEAHKEAGYKPNRSTACQLKQDARIFTQVAELQEEQLAMHQQATAAAAANAKVIESPIAEAEAARAKAMAEKGGAAAAVSALTALASTHWHSSLRAHRARNCRAPRRQQPTTSRLPNLTTKRRQTANTGRPDMAERHLDLYLWCPARDPPRRLQSHAPRVQPSECHARVSEELYRLSVPD